MPAYSPCIFLPHPTLYSLRKNVCGDFCSKFWIFNKASKSEILGSTGRTGCEKLPCINGYAHTFYTKSYGPRNSQIFIFDLFQNFRILKSYPPQSEVQVSRSRMGCGKLNFSTFQFFLTFFENLTFWESEILSSIE